MTAPCCWSATTVTSSTGWPAEIERLEAEIGKLEELLSDAELFTREPVKFQKATDALVQRHEKLSNAEEEWMALEEKAQG